MAVKKGQRSLIVGLKRELDILELASNVGGWTTPLLVGRWLWHEHPNADVYARQAIAKMVKKKYLLTRKLDAHRSAFVILQKGVDFAAEHGKKIRPGSRWGRLDADNQWRPPLRFRHDERAARFMIYQKHEGWSISFDHQTKVANSDAMKHPDGLCFYDGPADCTNQRLQLGPHTAWVEVEETRKDGADMRLLAEQIIAVTHEDAPYHQMPQAGRTVQVKPTQVKLVLPFQTRDRAGHLVNHRKRIVAAIERNLQDGDRSVAFWVYQEKADGNFMFDLKRIWSKGQQPDDDDTASEEDLNDIESCAYFYAHDVEYCD